MEQGHFSTRKWESEKHKSWSMPAEGFKGHVATDGSLLASGEHVVEQWYSWTTMERWSLCSGTCEGTPHEERKRKDDAI